MNRILPPFVLALILIALPAWGYVSPKILITTSTMSAANGYTNIEVVRDSLENTIRKSIHTAFPCSAPATEADVKLMLDIERQRELFGFYTDTSDKENQQHLFEEQAAAMDRLGEYSKSRYFIMLRILGIGETTDLTVLFMDRQTGKTKIALQRATGPASATDGVISEMASELVKKMAYFEICPYTGPVTVDVKTVKKKDEHVERAVFCNNTDGIYKKNQHQEKTTIQHWRLKRVGKPDTSGEMTATLEEFQEEREEDACYRCASGRQGGRIATKNSFISAQVNGLSDRTKAPGEVETHDAKIHLTFNEDGTYMMKMDGASNSSNYKGKQEEHAEGTCDPVNKKTNLTEAQILELVGYNRALPLTGIFGPFPGTPYDKRLNNKKELTLKDAESGEETVISVDFDLQRQ